MKEEILRKKPRVNLNIPAILQVNERFAIHCWINNASIDGFGIGISPQDFRHLRVLKIQKTELYWTPVPTMQAALWPVAIRRFINNSVGLELQKTKLGPINSKILKRLIHFHLKD